jgi:hypothetical protein
MNAMRVLSLFTVLALCGCSKEPANVGGPPQPAGAPPAAGGHHGDQIELGSLELAGFPMTARRGKDLQPGGELDLDLVFPAGKPLPPVARAWIGAQGAAGSLRTKLGKEGDNVLHGHVEVPKPLPAGSRLWVELEPGGGAKVSGSFDLKQ